MPRYIVQQSTCQAPSSGGGKFRRPVVVRVLDTTVGSPWHQVRYGVVREWRNVDSRYAGPRSAYGQALTSAHDLANRLNSAS